MSDTVNKPIHVMLDLETLSTRPNAAIIAIGAVTFEPESGEIQEAFYATVDAQSAEQSGLHISASTVLWWMQQSEEARKEFSRKGLPLRDALTGFSVWMSQFPNVAGFWGNGADFDNTVLQSAFEAVGVEKPWSFRANRCFRTLRAQFGHLIDTSDVVQGVAHNALSDAKWQAVVAMRILKKLEKNNG